MKLMRRMKRLFAERKKPDPVPVHVFEGKLLQSKNVLITGGAKNIGKGIACEMAIQGANVFFTDIDNSALLQMESTLAAFPVRSKGFVSDVSSQLDTDRLCDHLAKENIAIDILVNNVGIHVDHYGSDQSLWRRTFDNNFFGPAYLTYEIAKTMINGPRPGAVIFMSSIHQWSVQRAPAYSASKAAIGMLIKEMAVEFAPHNIRVNGIAPAWVREDSTEGPYKYAPLHQRPIEPCYIGRAAVFLASEYFSFYTTGTVLTIDAGTLLYNHRTDQKK